ncbi:type II toxin-antitoxin system RelE/ParE family toxin [Frankia sp. CNm7]|uniref:Type II toxin-antitoxin system RelE/ParE family toxin n=1 Tax=Frankia nepalensis TaxID=1836974 RepID=A0A937RLY2_9ACTN|nr:type II toxin-antitoxin system RelE/ParE family toxin [Frankia nepalensis]MBL7499821.1 type II toxin-antitoxin system RelE/ParE family toxin [Frankia nepalensis]MBL7513638.1 type II toxin-antitoxin system RelE/ParE family toxin [Frankia nepalensis]MBL7519849.1 type II toxin-antitoxin system RelE/ParE family toxin [Frankia nepalensis]MBL7631249.1 type II toxin-antitoxin system RelE/ParE family toxin [Frankia nepalensis]
MSEKYQLVIAPSAQKDLERLPELIAVDVRRFLNGPLRNDPYKAGKPLGEQNVKTRGREGEVPSATMFEAAEHSWRVLYRVDANTRTIRVMVVGHRPRVVRRLTDPGPQVPFLNRFR